MAASLLTAYMSEFQMSCPPGVMSHTISRALTAASVSMGAPQDMHMCTATFDLVDQCCGMSREAHGEEARGRVAMRLRLQQPLLRPPPR